MSDQDAKTLVVYDQDTAEFDDPPPVEGDEPDEFEEEPFEVSASELELAAFDTQGAHVQRVQNSGWRPTAHPRLTVTTAGQRGGSFIDNQSITKSLETLGQANLSSLGAGSQHIAHVQLIKTQNADQTMMKVGLKIEGQQGAYNVYLYVPTKNLQTQRLQSILVGLNNGLPIDDLAKKNGVSKVSHDARYYHAYTQFVRTIASAKANKQAGFKEDHVHEIAMLFFAESSSTASAEDGLMWKVALPVGELKVSPGYRGKAAARPLRVIEGRSHNPREAIGLQDLVDAFDEGAIQHVTLPLSHADRCEENTGFVRKVKIGQTKDGKRALMCGVDITEPEVKGKVERGTIAGCSVGIEFDYVKKDTGKTFKSVLQHLCLTNKPWVPGMPAFGVAADESSLVVPLMPADPDEQLAQWQEERGLYWRLAKIEQALEPTLGDFVVRDIDGDVAVVVDDQARVYEVPYDVTQEGVVTRPREVWRELARPAGELDIPEEWLNPVAETPATRDPDATPLKGDPDDISKPHESDLLQPLKPLTTPRPRELPYEPTQQLSEAHRKRRLVLGEK